MYLRYFNYYFNITQQVNTFISNNWKKTGTDSILFCALHLEKLCPRHDLSGKVHTQASSANQLESQPSPHQLPLVPYKTFVLLRLTLSLQHLAAVSVRVGADKTELEQARIEALFNKGSLLLHRTRLPSSLWGSWVLDVTITADLWKNAILYTGYDKAYKNVWWSS